MTIKLTLKLGGEIINVIIDGNVLMFVDSNGTLTTLEGLKISKGGVIKEHPDLEENPEWRKIAIERLKEHMKNLETEERKVEYVKNELVKFGYYPLYKQRAGFRPEKFK